MKPNTQLYEKIAHEHLVGNKRPATPNTQLVRSLHYKNILPPQDKGSKMLDVGCYDGGSMIYFGKYGYRVAGVDITQAQLELAEFNLNKEGIKPVTLKVLKNEIIDYPDEEFDFVLCWKTIYNTGAREKVEKLLSEMVRTLKPGKPIIINTLENDSIHFENSEKIGTNLYKYKIPRRSDESFIIRHHFENADEFVNLLEQYGIGNIEIGGHTGTMLHKPGSDERSIKRSFRIYYGEKVR